MNIAELRQKAESGSVVAQTILGTCYRDGIDVEVDYAEAFRFLFAASEAGVSRAMANLAMIYAHGLGIPKDMVEAIRLYEAAATRGEFLAQIELARIHSRGTDAPVDRDLAANGILRRLLKRLTSATARRLRKRGRIWTD